MGFVLSATFSTIALPSTIINFYESRKEYHEENPSRNIYVDYKWMDAKTKAGLDSDFLGMFLGGANILIAMAGYYNLSSNLKKKEE